MFGMADGSVQFVNQNIDITIYRQMAIRDDGFPVGGGLSRFTPPFDISSRASPLGALCFFPSNLYSRRVVHEVDTFRCWFSLQQRFRSLRWLLEPRWAVRYTLSGTITMPDGKPVPAGEINFEPDGQAGNKGPASMAQIRQGKYSLPKDQGVVGGKYIVRISPFDGNAFGESIQGRPLTKAQHVENVDFPMKNSTHDFKVTTK